jgi:hypothetical protein
MEWCSRTHGIRVHDALETANTMRRNMQAERVDTRVGHYERKLETKAGTVTLKMPKLRRLPFETAIIGCYPMRRARLKGIVPSVLEHLFQRRTLRTYFDKSIVNNGAGIIWGASNKPPRSTINPS